MAILDLIKKMPKYNYYKREINLLFKELTKLLNVTDGDDESLVLRRFEPLFKAPMDAEEAYEFLTHLKGIIDRPTPNVEMGFSSNSSRGRAIKLLDKYCAITSEPLIGVIDTSAMESGAYIDRSVAVADSQLTAADLHSANIHLDDHGYWYHFDDAPLQPGDKSIINESDNNVVAVTNNDQVVDFTFINSYLAFARQSAQNALLMHSKIGHELIRVLGLDATKELYEKSESKDLISIFHRAVLDHPKAGLNPILLKNHMAELRFSDNYHFMEHYANASPALIEFILPLAETYNLIRPYDYIKYPILTQLRPAKAEEAANKIAEASVLPDQLKASILADEFSAAPEVLNGSPQAQAMLVEFSRELATYSTKNKTRLKAMAKLNTAIQQGLHEVFDVLRDPQFQTDAGFHESHRTRKFFSQVVYSDICANFLSAAHAYINDRNNARRAFVTTASNDEKILRAILTGNDTYQIMMQNPQLLSEIYAKTPHKAVFIQAIYDHRNAATFPGLTLSNGAMLTYADTTRMLAVPVKDSAEMKNDDRDVENAAAWNQFNEVRHRFQLPSILPANAVYPKAGREELDQLTAEEKHQLIDSDIAAGEDFLRTKFKHLFINKVIDHAAPESKSESVSSASHNNSAVDPFFLSISEYMLLEPQNTGNGNYFRYRNFKKALPEYVNSAPGGQGHKPVVFMGVANVTNNHYIAYFVTKKLDGTIQVVTLDPSPQTYVAGTRSRSGELLDGKEKAIAKLKTIFSDIFPGCQYTDLNVTQQLLQRDCGFNALQTLYDVMSTLGQPNSLLNINPDGSMRFNTDNLTVNGNMDRGTNYSAGTHYYTEDFKRAGQANRQTWARRFNATEKRRLYAKSAEANSIAVTEEVGVFDDEYSYRENTLGQQHGDSGNEDLSQIFGQMISLALWADIETRFLHGLQEPTPQELEVMAQGVIAATAGGQATIDRMLPANQVLTSVLQDMARDALYQKVVSALFERFKAYLQIGKLKVAEDDNAKSLHDRFVSHDDIRSIYEKLTVTEKSSLQRDVRGYADAQIVNLKNAYCSNLAQRVLSALKQRADQGGMQDWLSNFFAESGNFANYDINMVQARLSASKILCDEIDAWSSPHSQEMLLSIINTEMPIYLTNLITRQIDAAIPNVKVDKMTARNEEGIRNVVPMSDAEIRVGVAQQLNADPDNALFKRIFDQALVAKKAQLKEAQKQVRDEILRVLDIVTKANQSLEGQGFSTDASKLENYIYVLSKMTSYLLDWSQVSLQKVGEKTAMNAHMLTEYRLQIASLLSSLYAAEETLPIPVAQISRQAIAALWNMPLSQYPTNQEIITFDRRVKAELKRNNMADASSSSPSIAVINSDEVKRDLVPNTYGRPLTRGLLIRLLDFWKIQSQSKDNKNSSGSQILPRSIEELISIVNVMDKEEISESVLARLRPLVTAEANASDFTDFAKVDMTKKVFLAILNTTTFSPAQPANAPVVVAEAKGEAPPLSVKKVEHVLNLFTGKEKASNSNPENFGAVLSIQLPDTAQNGATKTLFGSKKAGAANPVAVVIQNLCQAMRGRRQNQADDIVLDYTDLQSLVAFLANNTTIVVGSKLDKPVDRLYWAIASIVSDGLKAYGIEKAAAQLLGIHPNVKLATMRIPENKIVQESGFDADDDNVNSISPENLILLPPGYFVDGAWLIEQYESAGELVNPYTNEHLTAAEVADCMAQSPVLEAEFALRYEVRVTSGMERHIKQLSELCAEAFDPNAPEYSLSKRQDDAWVKFQIYLSTLSQREYDVFMAYQVVPMTSTVSTEALSSARRTKLKEVFLEDACLKMIGKCCVPLCYQYLGHINFMGAKEKAKYLGSPYNGLDAPQLARFFPKIKDNTRQEPQTLADQYVHRGLSAGVSASASASASVQRM